MDYVTSIANTTDKFHHILNVKGTLCDGSCTVKWWIGRVDILKELRHKKIWWMRYTHIDGIMHIYIHEWGADIVDDIGSIEHAEYTFWISAKTYSITI